MKRFTLAAVCGVFYLLLFALPAKAQGLACHQALRKVGVETGYTDRVNPQMTLLMARLSHDVYSFDHRNMELAGAWDIYDIEDKMLRRNGREVEYALPPGLHWHYAFQNAQIMAGYTENEAGTPVVVIVFRGTDSGGDALVDADIFRKKGVHSGFWEMTDEFRRHLEEDVFFSTTKGSRSLRDLIDSAASGEMAHFVITGHSMGGALAQVYAHMLFQSGVPRDRIVAYTYASPNPFDIPTWYQNMYSHFEDLRVYRFANEGDWVPGTGVWVKHGMGMGLVTRITAAPKDFGYDEDAKSYFPLPPEHNMENYLAWATHAVYDGYDYSALKPALAKTGVGENGYDPRSGLALCAVAEGTRAGNTRVMRQVGVTEPHYLHMEMRDSKQRLAIASGAFLNEEYQPVVVLSFSADLPPAPPGEYMSFWRNLAKSQDGMNAFCKGVLDDFRRQYEEKLAFPLPARLGMPSLRSLVTQAGEEGVHFLLTGHGLGGSIAQLYAYQLIQEGVPSRQVTAYTFGSLMPFTRERWDREGLNTGYRVYNISNSQAAVSGLDEETIDLLYVASYNPRVTFGPEALPKARETAAKGFSAKNANLGVTISYDIESTNYGYYDTGSGTNHISLFRLYLLEKILLAEAEDKGEAGSVLDALTYDSASAAGDVTNVPEPGEPTQEELSAFSVTPIEVVLVLDASGSMDRRNPNNGKSVLSYAQDAAVAFAQTLFSLNPKSRIAVVAYDDDVTTVCPLTNFKDSIALQASIRAIQTGGSTNTGGGYQRAGEILSGQAQGGRQRVVLMLSDGLANTGPDAATEGSRVSQGASVYTIGLVGGMSASEKKMARDILAKGYQTQYFEIDFSSVSDISLYLAESFLKIAMAGGQDAQETYYSLRVDGSMEVRVAHASGQVLCSAPDMLSTVSGYGVLHFLGDEMDDKLLVLREGDYDILLRGSRETVGRYALTGFNGVGADTGRLLDTAVKVHPATCIALRLTDGKVTQENILFNPIDPFAIDPFTGAPTKGLSLAAQGYASSNTAVYAASHKKATVLEKLSKNVPVNVFALDPLTGWYLVGITGGDGLPLRGWVDGKTLDIKGYVPEMQFIGGEYTLAESSPLCLAPSDSSRVAGQIAGGITVELKHVERDRSGEEWAYVKTAVKNKDTWGYVPSRMLAGFGSIAPVGFRLGGDMPLKVYDKTFGENKYSEWMWASSPADGGGGVILSGRTASTKGDITKALGGRDAWIMRLDEKGDVSKVLTTGGSEVDSYHCVLPTEQGYLVSGITRSLDKNFQGIWDIGYYKGTVPKKLSWSNALIGLLDESFEPIWLKSFGTGSGSYGFDMVLKLMDGSVAGVGWSTAGRGSVLSDHGKQDFYAVKLSQSGQVLAMNCFGGLLDDVPDGGVAAPDGGILMIGRTASRFSGGGRYDGYVLKLDASLAVEWEFTYGGNGEDTFDNVRMLADGTYLVTGFTNSTNGTGAGMAKGGMDFWAMRIDQFGRPIWNLRYGGSGDEELRGTALLEDGRLILVGDTTSQDGQVRGYQRAGGKTPPTDGWAVCINEMGKVLWQYCQGGPGNDYFNSAAVDPSDGCLVLAGVKEKKNDENAKAWVVKVQMPEY